MTKRINLILGIDSAERYLFLYLQKIQKYETYRIEHYVISAAFGRRGFL